MVFHGVYDYIVISLTTSQMTDISLVCSASLSNNVTTNFLVHLSFLTVCVSLVYK